MSVCLVRDWNIGQCSHWLVPCASQDSLQAHCIDPVLEEVAQERMQGWTIIYRKDRFLTKLNVMKMRIKLPELPDT